MESLHSMKVIISVDVSQCITLYILSEIDLHSHSIKASPEPSKPIFSNLNPFLPPCNIHIFRISKINTAPKPTKNFLRRTRGNVDYARQIGLKKGSDLAASASSTYTPGVDMKINIINPLFITDSNQIALNNLYCCSA